MRESLAGANRIGPYFISRTIADIPLQTFFSFLFSVSVYFLIDLRQDAYNFFIFAGVMVLVAYGAASIGYFIGSLTKIPGVGLAIGKSN